MKKYIIMLYLTLFCILSAQNGINLKLLGGVTTAKNSDTGISMRAEISKRVFYNFFVTAGVGYFTTTDNTAYERYKYYSYKDLSGNTIYTTSTDFVKKTEYTNVPIGIGIDYRFITKSPIYPYLGANFSYNLIDTNLERSIMVHSTQYTSSDAVPEKFKTDSSLPENSTIVALYLGTEYKLSAKVNLNIRFTYNIDNEIENSHHILFGIGL